MRKHGGLFLCGAGWRVTHCVLTRPTRSQWCTVGRVSALARNPPHRDGYFFAASAAASWRFWSSSQVFSGAK
jgi:hypothetical protein